MNYHLPKDYEELGNLRELQRKNDAINIVNLMIMIYI